MQTQVSQRNFGFKGSNTENVQALVESKSFVMSNKHGDGVGLDASSPGPHKVASAIQDANEYHSRARSINIY